jgi:hypothetical protein
MNAIGGNMKRMALVFAAVFALLGAAGFVPALCPDGRTFGLFATNDVHNLFYLASGALGLFMSMGTRGFARKYFRIVGAVYGVVAVMGFLEGGRGMLFGMAMNWPDNVLDLAIAIAAVLIGTLWAGAATDQEPVTAGRPLIRP